MQLAERPAKGLLLTEIDRLVAKEQHLMFRQGGVPILDLPIAQ